jgi:hypothetical protein
MARKNQSQIHLDLLTSFSLIRQGNKYKNKVFLPLAADQHVFLASFYNK